MRSQRAWPAPRCGRPPPALGSCGTQRPGGSKTPAPPCVPPQRRGWGWGVGGDPYHAATHHIHCTWAGAHRRQPLNTPTTGPKQLGKHAPGLAGVVQVAAVHALVQGAAGAGGGGGIGIPLSGHSVAGGCGRGRGGLGSTEEACQTRSLKGGQGRAWATRWAAERRKRVPPRGSGGAAARPESVCKRRRCIARHSPLVPCGSTEAHTSASAARSQRQPPIVCAMA